MATTLSGGSVRFNLTATETTAVGATNRVMSLAPAGSYSATIANGTASSQANTLASVTGTVGTTAITINLRTLTLAGVDDPLTFTSIRGILIQETTSPIGSNYLIAGDSTGTLTNAVTGFWNSSSSTEKVSSGGAVAAYNPIGVTVDASHYLLQLVANSGTATYQIDIIGTK